MHDPQRARRSLCTSLIPTRQAVLVGWLLLPLLILLQAGSVIAGQDDEVALGGAARDGSYALGETVKVECLNRTTDTGEHVTDAKGELQYIPFPSCNETGKPLEFSFGSEKDINCTLDSLPDPLFHLFEFYIHNDAPLSCRVPSLPLSGDVLATQDYTHLQVALTGTLQLSHLHINPRLNVIIHTTSPLSSSSSSKRQRKSHAVPEGQILAATAYSLPPTLSSPRLVIGDPLPLQFSVRWYSARSLPPSTARLAPSGLGGHVHFSTVVYCLISFGGGVAVSLAYWRGVELPRRMRRYGAEKLGMGEAGRGGYAFPGKRD